jgi:hypothetical protein
MIGILINCKLYRHAGFMQFCSIILLFHRTCVAVYSEACVCKAETNVTTSFALSCKPTFNTIRRTAAGQSLRRVGQTRRQNDVIAFFSEQSPKSAQRIRAFVEFFRVFSRTDFRLDVNVTRSLANTDHNTASRCNVYACASIASCSTPRSLDASCSSFALVCSTR